MEQTSSNDTFPGDNKPEEQARLQMTRPVIIGIALTLVVAIIFAAFLVFRNHTPTSSHPMAAISTSTPTATATIAPTPTASTPTHWEAVQSINYAKGIAFAQSSPNIGYVCGNNGIIGGTVTNIQLGITHDGGNTWSSPLTTSVKAASCDLYVNPYNASDIIMLDIPCWDLCASPPPGGFSRSIDGGKTWNLLAVPPGVQTTFSESYQQIYLATPVWTPTALFFTLILSAQDIPPQYVPPAHYIAVSINGGPLTWTAQEPGFPFDLLHGAHPAIFSLGNTINAYIYGNLAAGIATSSDNGATWSRITPAGSKLPWQIKVMPDGRTLIGDISQSTALVNSTDGGKTWSNPPSILDGMIDMYTPLGTPDGTLFGGKDGKICELPAGTTTWKCDIPYGSGYNFTNAGAPPIYAQSFKAISWDNNGHPKFVWSTTEKSNTNDEEDPKPATPILEYYSA
jgi:hypothetical protein